MKKHLSRLLAAVLLLSNCSTAYAGDFSVNGLAGSDGPTDAAVIAAMASAVSDTDTLIVPDEGTLIPEEDTVSDEGSEDEISEIQTYSDSDDTEVEAYADDDDVNMLHLENNDSNGKYIMYFKMDYEYKQSQSSGQGAQNNFKNDGVYAQLRNISPIEGKSEVEGDVIIPDYVKYNGKDVPVVSIKKSAFEGCSAKSITLPDTIHEIQERAFHSCPKLENVYIDTVYSADRVYEDINIDLDTSKNNLQSVIGNDAFYNCTALKKVYIHGFAKIGNNAFKGCTSLTDVTIDNEDVFTIAKGVEKTTNLLCVVGTNAFDGCSALKELDTGWISTLGKNSLLGCTSLETINIGKPFTTVLDYSYILECLNLSEFTVNEDNTKFIAQDGVLYSKTVGNVINSEGTSEKLTYPSGLISYPPNKQDADFVLPALVTGITAKAFYNQRFLKSFSVDAMPNYTKDTGEIASQRTVTIGNEAFYGASALEWLEFNTPVTLGTSCYNSCPVLGKVTFNALANVGASCFRNCPELTDLICGDTVNINDYAFADCISLKNWTYSTDSTVMRGKIGGYAFSGCISLPGLELYNHQNIGVHAFENCTGLRYLVLDTTGTCGDYAFAKCTSLETIDISGIFNGPDSGNYKLGKYVFSDCTSLKSCIYTQDIDGISAGTFKNCTSLTDFSNQHPKYMFCIYTEAFSGCTALTEAPTSRFLTRVDKNAFYNCTSLTDATLTRSAIILDNAAYTGCDKLFITTSQNSAADTYGHLNNIPVKYIPDDIKDEEFLVYGIIPDPADSTGKTLVYALVGYLGGFTSITLPEKIIIDGQTIDIFGGKTKTTLSFHYDSIDGFADLGFHGSSSAWISSPANPDCSMKPYLESITLTGIRDVNTTALAGCPALKYVKFDNTLEIIRDSAFADCKALEKVDFSDGKQPKLEFCKKAFYNCSSLKEIEFPLNTWVIRESCFENCTGLEYAKFTPKIEDVELKAFKNCPGLTTITLQTNMFVHDDAFASCPNITRIIIPTSVNTAPTSKAFSGCNPENTYVLCTKDSKGDSYAKDAGFNTEIVEFIENSDNYTRIKSKIIYPEEIIVKRNGQVIPSGEFIYEGDVLDISYNKGKLDAAFYYSVLLNNKGLEVPEEGPVSYTVHENEYIEITVNKGARQQLTFPDGVVVLKNGTALSGNFAYIIAGDVLEIKATDDPYKNVTAIKYNGTNIPKNGIVTVPKDKDIEVTATVKTRGKLTFPEELTVKVNKTAVTESPVPVDEKASITIEVLRPEEGYENKVYVNGNAITPDKNGIYTYVVKATADNASVAEDVTVTYEVVSLLNFAYGDADADGELTASDSAAILQKVLDEKYVPELAKKTADYVTYLDVDKDKNITASDAADVLQKVLDEKFKFQIEK